MDGFRAFAAQIEEAAASKDAQFFTDRAELSDLTCTGDEQLGPCMGESAGTVLSGIPGSFWRSDASALWDPEAYRQEVASYFNEARDDLSDQFGSGAPMLYALASGPPGYFAADPSRGEEETHWAIVTTLALEGEQRRFARLFAFAFREGRWVFVAERLSAGTGADDFLSGDCVPPIIESFCPYNHWERWEGEP